MTMYTLQCVNCNEGGVGVCFVLSGLQPVWVITLVASLPQGGGRVTDLGGEFWQTLLFERSQNKREKPGGGVEDHQQRKVPR